MPLADGRIGQGGHQGGIQALGRVNSRSQPPGNPIGRQKADAPDLPGQPPGVGFDSVDGGRAVPAIDPPGYRPGDPVGIQ